MVLPDTQQEIELVEIVSLTPNPDDQKSSKPIKKWRTKKYWLTVAMNSIIFIGVFVLLIKFKTNVKPVFKCQDPKLSFPYPEDTVTNFVLFFVNMVGPVLIIVFIELTIEGRINGKLLKHCKKWCFEYYIGFCFHTVLLVAFKTGLPEPRPHFFDSCKPDAGDTCLPGEYVKEYECMNKNLLDAIDSQRSFPSGHASYSVYGSVFCAWFIHRRLLFPTLDAIVKPVIILGILLWCTICSLTRITDNRHHWWDVIFGVIFGLLNAFYVIIGRCNRFEPLK